MRTYNTSAIVLKRYDLAEKDRILVLYTREYGKLSAVAKGARKPGSKVSGASEPVTYCRLSLSKGSELDVVTQSEIKESFPVIKRNLDSVAHSLYLMELVEHVVDERQSNIEIFDTLLSSLYVLESSADPEIVTRYFELKILEILGYKPHFDACLRCKGTLVDDKLAFSPTMGGLVCPDCGTPPKDAIWIPAALTTYITALENTEPQNLGKLKFPKGARRDLQTVLKWHIFYRMERKMKSTSFLDLLSDRLK